MGEKPGPLGEDFSLTIGRKKGSRVSQKNYRMVDRGSNETAIYCYFRLAVGVLKLTNNQGVI